MFGTSSVPSELNLVFRMIRSSEARELALTCYKEINNYLLLIDRLPRPGIHLRQIVDESVRLCLARLHPYERLTGVSAAAVALGAFYSNEARRCFTGSKVQITKDIDPIKVPALAGGK